jgi:HNH endonuclease
MILQSEKGRLVEAAKALRLELAKSYFQSSVRVATGNSKPFKTVSAGWAISIASWSSGPRIELWLDKWLPGTKSAFWFGFISGDDSKVISVINQVPESLQPKVRYGDGDFQHSAGVRRLKKRPSEAELLHPIFESYPSEKVWCFGMYDRGTHVRGKKPQLDVGRANSFISLAVQSNDDLSQDYPTIRKEGRRIVALHVRLERDQRVALRCKQRDGFRCQVCTLRFEEWYGVSCVEAHHKVPLSKLKRPKAAHEDDLITVCPNCHRMLHRMSGHESDIEELKDILKARGYPLVSGISQQ